jgi:hypothetical protein
MITGDTPDIFEWLDFDFYDLVWYWDCPHLAITKDNPRLGRRICVAHRVGSDMCYKKGNVLACTTEQHVIQLDLKTDVMKAKVQAFEKALRDWHNDANFIAENEGFYMKGVIFDDDQMEEVNAFEQDDCTDEVYDQYVEAELLVGL